MTSCEIKLTQGAVQMPISYSLNSQEGYLEVKCEGLISDKEILTERMTYMGRADWIPGTNELVDLSEADFSEVTPDGILHLSNTIDHIYKAHGVTTIKVAVYTQDLLPSVITSLYSDIAQESVENIRVFNDLVEAKKWLQDDLIGMKYTIDLDKDIIYCKYVGTITAEDLIQHILTIRKDPKFHSKLHTIADLREATFTDYTRDMIRISEFSHASHAARGPFKLALISSRTSKQNIELYTTLTVRGHAEMFYSMSDAENWIHST